MVFFFTSSSTSSIFSFIPIIFIIMIGFMIFNITLANQSNNQNIIMKLPSNVIDKQEKTIDSINDISRYYITFEFESGKRIKLEVDEDAFYKIEIDSYGDLEYKGNTFISFKKY